MLSGKDGSSQRTDEYLNRPSSKEHQDQADQKKVEHLQAAQEQIAVFLEGGHTAAAVGLAGQRVDDQPKLLFNFVKQGQVILTINYAQRLSAHEVNPNPVLE